MKYIDNIIKKAKQECKDSQFILAEYYYKGIYFDKDENEALYWYYKASKNGNKDANKKIGLILFLGTIVESDKSKAKDFLLDSDIKKSCLDIMYSEKYPEKSKLKIAMELLNNKIENDLVKYNGNAVLLEKVVNGSLEEVKELIHRGADANLRSCFNGQTVLHKAIEKNNKDIAKFLIISGADINVQDTDKNTTLMYAVKKKNFELVNFLIDKGLSINAKNNKGDTALLMATDLLDFEIVKLLIEKGANLNIINKKGKTPLSSALEHEDEDIFDFLMKKGANIDYQDEHGKTLLMKNITFMNDKRCIEKLKKLLKWNANREITDNIGYSCIDYAKLYSNKMAVEILNVR